MIKLLYLATPLRAKVAGDDMIKLLALQESIIIDSNLCAYLDCEQRGKRYMAQCDFSDMPVQMTVWLCDRCLRRMSRHEA